MLPAPFAYALSNVSDYMQSILPLRYRVKLSNQAAGQIPICSSRHPLYSNVNISKAFIQQQPVHRAEANESKSNISKCASRTLTSLMGCRE